MVHAYACLIAYIMKYNRKDMGMVQLGTAIIVVERYRYKFQRLI